MPSMHSPLTNRDAVKLITQALRSNDFIVTPDFTSAWHIKYIYDRPKSLHVVDLAVITLDHGIFASTDIRLLLPIDRVVKQRGMDDAGAAPAPRLVSGPLTRNGSTHNVFVMCRERDATNQPCWNGTEAGSVGLTSL